jgi:site-specific DNA recombinase
MAHTAVEGDAQQPAQQSQLAARIQRLGRQEQRLLDAYQAEVISLEELTERRQHLAVLGDLTRFCERVRGRLQDATFAEKRAILELLVERIIVGEDTLEVRHVIPLRGPAEPGGGASLEPTDSPNGRLRSDGKHRTQQAQDC